MKKSNIAFIFIFLLVSTLLLNTGVRAQTMNLTVFPAIQDKEVVPNQKTRLQVQFKNGSNKIVSGEVKLADFVVIDKEGTPQLIEDTSLKPKYAASQWINVQPKLISIPPNDFVTVDLFITPPAEINSCGNYALVYFEPDAASLGKLNGLNSASSISAKIGGLLNFTVKDKVCKEQVNLLNFKTPTFLEYGPIKVSFDLLNLSDVHVSPEGILILTDMFGKTVDQQSIKEQRIFPEAQKPYSNNLGPKWLLGRYRVSLEASYGSQGKHVEHMAYIWIIPWKVILALLLALILLFLFVRFSIDKLAKRETYLETQLKKEKEEIAELKEELKKRND